MVVLITKFILTYSTLSNFSYWFRNVIVMGVDDPDQTMRLQTYQKYMHYIKTTKFTTSLKSTRFDILDLMTLQNVANQRRVSGRMISGFCILRS